MSKFSKGTQIVFKGYKGQVIEVNGDRLVIQYDVMPFLPVIHHTTVSDRDIQIG